MRPRGLSPLPVRPLRLSPITATAGGRATATPGTDPHQLAAVTPTGHGPRQTPRPPPGAPGMKLLKPTVAYSSGVPSPALIIV
jgi:hypothetical protein